MAATEAVWHVSGKADHICLAWHSDGVVVAVFHVQNMDKDSILGRMEEHVIMFFLVKSASSRSVTRV